MAKGQHLSRHQQGIVKRYYEHAPGMVGLRLAEIVSDLYLAESEKARAKLWAKAEAALAKAPVDKERAARTIASQDLADLAKLAGIVDAGGSAGKR